VHNRRLAAPAGGSVSPLTAKTHVSNILRKLDCRDRAGLVALADETGLITPGGRE
jgi:ATP/maltotriose-dependent transcriptional regulator MalT